ncbi:MAG: NTP transferase domain-containing protein [Lachnospira sp.]|uniref:mannose-1-phosphate guanylyltransferase n=1 Tax=Lachnospira sp. TaxID=2049031 RepID=UPI003030FAB4|nr:NTP transferase domain-containing protein [Lachnospira sp.]
MKKTALIMAGGKGERFWPRSRVTLPKQFLSLTDDGKTMIQLTVERIRPLVELEDVYIATNKNYKELVKQQLPGLPEENILCEPVGRNTAPCIGLGAVHVAKKYDDAVMIVLPSDHLIKHNDIFAKTFTNACALAEEGENLVTVGITPNYPETGYGYIKYDSTAKNGESYPVQRFVEKPDLETAKSYLADGSYLWNSGMFVWRVSTILDCFKKYMPSTYDGLLKIKEAVGTPQEDTVLEKEFPNLESQSVDYGIMEKAENIYTLAGNFGWDDVGSWLAVGRIKQNDENGNVVNGNVVAVNTKNCVIEGADKLIATVGLRDVVVVDTKDATLITTKENAGEIKQVLAKLRESGRNEYL